MKCLRARHVSLMRADFSSHGAPPRERADGETHDVVSHRETHARGELSCVFDASPPHDKSNRHDPRVRERARSTELSAPPSHRTSFHHPLAMFDRASRRVTSRSRVDDESRPSLERRQFQFERSPHFRPVVQETPMRTLAPKTHVCTQRSNVSHPHRLLEYLRSPNARRRRRVGPRDERRRPARRPPTRLHSPRQRSHARASSRPRAPRMKRSHGDLPAASPDKKLHSRDAFAFSPTTNRQLFRRSRPRLERHARRLKLSKRVGDEFTLDLALVRLARRPRVRVQRRAKVIFVVEA